MVTKGNTPRKTLTPKQTQVLHMILGGSSITDAAQAAGVSRKTIHAWYQQPQFTQALTNERTLALEKLSNSLASLSEKAVMTLDAAMDDPNSTTRVRAADIIISRMLSYADQVELAQRISELEKAVSRYINPNDNRRYV